MKKYYPGNVVEGKVIGIKPYGVFISLDKDFVGLLHISEISDSYIPSIDKIVKIGDIIKTKILDINYDEKKAKLSVKALKRRERYKYKNKNKHSLVEEKFNLEKEFLPIKVRMEDYINDAKERLNIND